MNEKKTKLGRFCGSERRGGGGGRTAWVQFLFWGKKRGIWGCFRAVIWLLVGDVINISGR